VEGEYFAYELKSSVCHEGISTSSGHYTAAIRSGASFICCNNDTVSFAYLNKYQKRHTH